jgi:predicted CoA-binding protein
LVFRKLEDRPAGVDIVVVYRPEKEMAGIVADHVLPLNAKTVWLLRPLGSENERVLFDKHGIQLIENCDIVAAARAIAPNV